MSKLSKLFGNSPSSKSKSKSNDPLLFGNQLTSPVSRALGRESRVVQRAAPPLPPLPRSPVPPKHRRRRAVTGATGGALLISPSRRRDREAIQSSVDDLLLDISPPRKRRPVTGSSSSTSSLSAPVPPPMTRSQSNALRRSDYGGNGANLVSSFQDVGVGFAGSYDGDDEQSTVPTITTAAATISPDSAAFHEDIDDSTVDESQRSGGKRRAPAAATAAAPENKSQRSGGKRRAPAAAAAAAAAPGNKRQRRRANPAIAQARLNAAKDRGEVIDVTGTGAESVSDPIAVDDSGEDDEAVRDAMGIRADLAVPLGELATLVHRALFSHSLSDEVVLGGGPGVHEYTYPRIRFALTQAVDVPLVRRGRGLLTPVALEADGSAPAADLTVRFIQQNPNKPGYYAAMARKGIEITWAIVKETSLNFDESFLGHTEGEDGTFHAKKWVTAMI